MCRDSKLVDLPRDCLRVIFTFLTPYDFYTSTIFVCKGLGLFSTDSILMNFYLESNDMGSLKRKLALLTKPSYQSEDVKRKAQILREEKIQNSILFNNYNRFIDYGVKNLSNGVAVWYKLGHTERSRNRILRKHDMIKFNVSSHETDSWLFDLCKKIFEDLKRNFANPFCVTNPFLKLLRSNGYNVAIRFDGKKIFACVILWEWKLKNDANNILY